MCSECCGDGKSSEGDEIETSQINDGKYIADIHAIYVYEKSGRNENETVISYYSLIFMRVDYRTIFDLHVNVSEVISTITVLSMIFSNSQSDLPE